MNFAVSELFSYLGGLMGLLLMVVTICLSKKSNVIKYSLALFLLVWSLVTIFGALTYSRKIIHFIHIFRLDSPIHFLLGPTVYILTLSLIKVDFKLRKTHLMHLLPFLANALYFSSFYFSPTAYKLEYYKQQIADGTVVMPIQYLLKTLSLLTYVVVQIFLYKKFQNQKRIHNKTDTYQTSWFILYFGSQFILTTGGLIDHFSGLHLFADPYRFSTSMITGFLCFIIVAILFFPNILYGDRKIEVEIKEKYSYSKLSDEVKLDILNNLNGFMKGENKPFLNEKISMAEVAKILEVSTQQISQVINEKTNLNFNDFVNAHRVEEAKTMLLSASYSKHTIDAIAQKSGFKSKSVFYAAFKKHTGNTQKEYIANASTIFKNVSPI